MVTDGSEVDVDADVDADDPELEPQVGGVRGPPDGPPIPTEVAVTVLEVSVPNTATREPTLTSASDADPTPNSL